MPVVLYSAAGSPPCSFVRCLAKLIGVELELKEFVLLKKQHLTPEFLKVNPFHKVPTIDDAGFVVYESIAIAYYLLRKYAPNFELYPECVKLRARIDQILAVIPATTYSHQKAFFVPRYINKTKPTEEELAAFGENVLKGLEHLIGDRKYAVSDKLTLADVALVTNMAGIFEAGCFDKAKFEKLANYYERVKCDLPGFEEICGFRINLLKQCWSELK